MFYIHSIFLYQLLWSDLCSQGNLVNAYFTLGHHCMLHFPLLQALSAGITCFVVNLNYLKCGTVNLLPIITCYH